MTRQQRGFTLMEVSLVVGLITTIAYLSYGSLREVRRGFMIDSAARGYCDSRLREVKQFNGNPVIVAFGSRHMTPFFDLDGNDSFSEGTDRRLRPAPEMPLFLKLEALEGENIVRFNSQGYSVDKFGRPIEVNVAVYDNSPRYRSMKRHKVDVLVSGAVRCALLIDPSPRARKLSQ